MTNVPVTHFLRFGIPSLDRIINTDLSDRDGIRISGNESTSISIIGPDGTGKSILALHLAAYYLLDKRLSLPPPLVLYVSTDLSYSMAHDRTWKPFALDTPGLRTVPFDDRQSKGAIDNRIELLHLRPLGYENPADGKTRNKAPKSQGNASTGESVTRATTVAAFLKPDPAQQPKDLQVGFIDLAANSAGDDWGFVNRVLASLPAPEGDSPAHLMILDALEGFETLVGDLDAYGQSTSRRDRIAQLMRSAHSRCHLVFVAEEPSDERRLPEQFVTDVVLRLRKRHAGDYIRRTLEVEKARGLEHVRGMHPYVIRSGRGSTTGSLMNCDDPRIERKGEEAKTSNLQQNAKPKEECQGYVHVFPSLHRYARVAMQTVGKERPQKPADAFAAFGIHYLDNMLGGDFTKKVGFRNGYETSGLPCATVTALIGDSLTQKTKLGRAFLSRCFAQYPHRLQRIVAAATLSGDKLREHLKGVTDATAVAGVLKRKAELCGVDGGRWKVAAEILEEALKKACPDSPDSRDGAAIYLTTHDVDQDMLVNEFWGRLRMEVPGLAKDADLQDVVKGYCRKRTICRRLEVHDLPSPVFMHIVQRAVRGAQCAVLGEVSDDPDERFKRSHKIRLVIDDFSAVLATYTEMRNDPLFLPALLFFLRREGVTSLIVDTHSGQPGAALSESAATDLRTLVDQRLFTWHVPFFGENRVAIAPIPPLTGVATVRELKKNTKEEDSEELDVDPEFEMYSGLESRQPQPVPLEVHIHQETPAFQKYMTKENLFYQTLFAPNTNRQGGNRDIIISRGQDYETFRDFCYLDSNIRLDHTLVFEVDEFWATRRPNALADLGPYLREVVSENKKPSAAGDPFEVFQPSKSSGSETYHGGDGLKADEDYRFRHFPLHFFSDNSPAGKDSAGEVDRVPFCWDFGFLVCRKRAWELAATDPDVKAVWNKLRKVSDRGQQNGKEQAHEDRGLWMHSAREDELYRKHKNERTTWYEFFKACRRVAKSESVRTGTAVPAFDLSLLSPESFSCLVLEIWASEFAKSSAIKGVTQRSWSGEAPVNGLIELLDEPNMKSKYEKWMRGRKVDFQTQWLALYKTWLMLGETLDLGNLADPSSSFEFAKRNPDTRSVAIRHWYKTASAENAFSPSDPTVLTQLPGRYSVRGDWFLAVSRNSRSMRLAHRAIDILSSRRGNINRLTMGVGLPVRDVEPGPRTCLFKPGQNGERHTVTYADLRYIGADSEGSPSPIRWLWRSQLKDYDRHARVFHQWLCRMMIRLQQMKSMIGPDWIDGMQVVEELNTNGKYPETASLTLGEFVKRLQFLIADLKQASPL